MLDEVAIGDAALELLRGEEVVFDAVALARAGLRVVADTDSSSSGSRSSRPRISVPFPTPEGPVITKTMAATGCGCAALSGGA